MSDKPDTMPIYRPTSVTMTLRMPYDIWVFLKGLPAGSMNAYVNDAIREKMAKGEK